MIDKTTAARASLFLFLTALPLLAAQSGPLRSSPSEPASFPLKEISPFDTRELTRGQTAMCQKEPFPEVKKYPRFSSGKPLYGKVNFDGTPYDPASGIAYCFALDESQGTDKGYDRLYFDLNRNLDLTDDKPLAIMKDSPLKPDAAMRNMKATVFEYIDVPFDYGEPYGIRPFRLLPQLLQNTQAGLSALSLIATAARKGKIKIGGRESDFTMGQAGLISGRYDRPFTYVQLSGSDYTSYEMQYLKAMRFVAGKWYSLSTTAIGDMLFVTPYEGELGVFEIGAGGRNVKGLSMQGALESLKAFVPVGGPRGASAPDPRKSAGPPAQVTIPVGDYLPGFLHVTFGRLRIFLSQNYHSDGVARDRQVRPPVYGIHIRKDKPFVLDFSNKPEVLFVSPAKSTRAKRGGTVEIKAVLTDPVLDVMIRDIKDSSRKEKKEYRVGDKTETFDVDVTLDPTVAIKDSSGAVVAEGKMPFG